MSDPHNKFGALPPKGLEWLYIDFNSYFASVEQQMEPRLRGRPVAVIPVETDSTCAIAASYEAKAFGIRTGTPVYEAKKLCPDLICVLARHNSYVDFHDRILDEIDQHIPVEKVCSIDEMACRLMRNEKTPARVAEIAASIKQGLARNVGEYVRCSIGVASSKYLAKVATDLNKPDGFTVLHPDALPGPLMGLALRDLPGIGHNMEVRLNKAGIRDMRGLMAQNQRQMRLAWGSVWGEKMWYYLRGYDLPDEETTRRTIGHSHVLSPDMRPPAKARDIALRLTMKAAARLRRMQYRASRISLSLRIENGPRLGLEGCCAPAHDTFTFQGLLDEMWQALMTEVRGQRIKKISVNLYGLVEEAEVGRQGDLFSDIAVAPKTGAADPKSGASVQATPAQRRVAHEKISAAMDKLNHKFGKDTVLLGLTPQQGRAFTGTKIAFTRIPDKEEFLE